MTEIPQHLLERTQRRREQLELAAETSPPVTRLESRLNGVVDMASEACSLLAEHVATLVSQEVEKAACDIESPDPDHTYLLRRAQLLDTPEGEPVSANRYFIPIAEKCLDDTRIEKLGITGVVETIPPPKKKLFKSSAERYQLANPERADIAVLTNRELIIPLFGVSLAQHRKPDCAFVTRMPDGLYDSEEVLMARDDVEGEPAGKQALEVLLNALRNLQARNLEIEKIHASTPAGSPASWKALLALPALEIKLADTGITGKLNRYIGEYDLQVENVIELFKRDLGSVENVPQGLRTRRVGRDVQLEGIDYDGVIEIDLMRTEPHVSTIDTTLHLPGAPSFGKVPVFPRLRYYSASGVPVRFDGVKPGEEAHKQLLGEFNMLIAELK